MSIKFKNNITVKLTDEQSNFLIELMNNNFMINNFSDAIRYCINSEMHYQKITKKHDELSE